MFERMVQSAWWGLSTLSSRVMLFLGAEDVLRFRGQRVGHTFGASIIGNTDQHRVARVPLAEGDDLGLVRCLEDKIVIAEAGRARRGPRLLLGRSLVVTMFGIFPRVSLVRRLADMPCTPAA